MKLSTHTLLVLHDEAVDEFLLEFLRELGILRRAQQSKHCLKLSFSETRIVPQPHVRIGCKVRESTSVVAVAINKMIARTSLSFFCSVSWSLRTCVLSCKMRSSCGQITIIHSQARSCVSTSILAQ